MYPAASCVRSNRRPFAWKRPPWRRSRIGRKRLIRLAFHCLPDKMYSVASRFSCVHAEGLVPGRSRSGGCRMFDLRRWNPTSTMRSFTQAFPKAKLVRLPRLSCVDLIVLVHNFLCALRGEKNVNRASSFFFLLSFFLQSLMLADRACVYSMLINLMESREAGGKPQDSVRLTAAPVSSSGSQ